MTGLKRYVLIVGLALLLAGGAGSAQGLRGGQQVDTGAVGVRDRTLEGGGAPIRGHAWATTGRCVACFSVRGAAADDEEADLAVAKTDDPDPVVAGETLTYTLVITNSGPVTATNVLVTDTLPSGVSFDTADPSQGWYNSVTGVWTVDAVADGDSATLTLLVTVDPSRRGTLSNSAQVSADETDPTPGNNAVTDVETRVNAEADLAISKTDDPDLGVVAGEALTYTLAITNSGPSDATGVAVVDTLPSGVSFDSAASSQGSYNSATGVWTVGSLADGGSATLTLFVIVDPSQRESLSNSAEVAAEEFDPNTANNDATESTDVDAEADLAIVKTDDPDPVIAGETLTYTLTVTNSGPSDATGVVVTDTLPLSVTFDSATYSQGTYDDVTGVWTVGPVADEDSATLTLLVTVDPSKRGSLSNSAEVSGDESDPTPVDNTAAAATQVDAKTDLAIAKTDDPDPVSAGEALTYTLTVTNSGPSDATGVIVTDHLPDEVSRLSATPSQGTCSGSEPVICNVGPLASGANASVSLLVDVTSPLTNGTVLTNIVTVEGNESDPNEVNDSAQAHTRVQSSPVLTITKHDDPHDPVDAGGALAYTLVITNSGNENATGVTVTEHYDPNVSFVGSFPSPADSENRVWTWPTVAVGDPKTIFISVQVTNTLLPGTVLTNRATLDSDQTTPVTVTEVTSVTSASELTVSKFDFPDSVDAGETLQYLIWYQNSADPPALDVVITETYDSRVTYVSADPPPKNGTDNVWNIPYLPGRAADSIEIMVTAPKPLTNGTVLTNLVTMDSMHTDPQSVTVTTTVASAPALTLYVRGYPDPVRAGDPLTYTLRYSNTGNADATQAVVTATLDVNTTFSGATPLPTDGSDQVLVWDVGTIAGDDGQGNHGQGEIVIYAGVPAALSNDTILELTAQLADAEGDSLVRFAQTTVRSLPDLVIRPVGEGHAPSLFSPNKEMTYTVAYTNAGYEAAQDVIIATVLPTGTAYVGYVWHDSGGGTYTYAHGPLPAHSPGYTITFTVRHADTPEVSAPEFNTPFTIAGRGGIAEDENPADNTTSVHIDVPDLVIDDLSIEPALVSVQPNVPVTFTFTITLMNQGTGTAHDPEHGGDFFVDVFTAPVRSWPFERGGEFQAEVGAIAPGVKSPPLVITAPITPSDRSLVFYIKVDNHERYPYGLVPEFDEMNNLGVWPSRVLLPIVLRNYGWDEYYEPNDDWRSAYGPLASGRTYLAYPDDPNDYYYFTLRAWTRATVNVDDYAPTSVGLNTVALYRDLGDGPVNPPIRYWTGDDDTEMVLGGSDDPLWLGPGKYYVRVYTEKRQSTTQLYRLTVTY